MDWVILRTRGRDTLKLAEKLILEGFDAWTPRRTFARIEEGEMLTVTAPLLPSFAFARAGQIHSLLAMAGSPSKPVEFSVFRYLNEIPFVGDRELDPLRRIEANDLRRLEEGRAKRRKPAYAVGQEIRIEFGSFAGLTGRVRRDGGKYVEIDLGLRTVKISAFLLGEENISLAA